MRPAPSRPPAPRPAALLLLGALIVCAVFVLRARLVRPAPLPPVSATPTPAVRLDPAISLDRPNRQGEFSLLAVTRAEENGFLSRPGTLALETGFSGGSGGTDATGLWILAAGGIGVQRLPVKVGRTVFPLVGGRLAVTLSKTNRGLLAVATDWLESDGVTPLKKAAPYNIQVMGTQQEILLSPRDLSPQFHLTAQPLRADGKPLGGPVTLACFPAGRETLLAVLPAGYSAETRAFDVILTRPGVPSDRAHWRIANLPRPAPPPAPPSHWVENVQMGKLDLRAQAWESPDRDWSNVTYSPERLKLPQNLDGHAWTGVPTVRCRLDAVARHPSASEEWAIGAVKIDLPWQARKPPVVPAPPQDASRLIQAESAPDGAGIAAPFGIAASGGGSPASGGFGQAASGPPPVFNFSRPVSLLLAAPSSGSETVRTGRWEGDYGVAYPGQQRFVRVRGETVRYRFLTEFVTFRDADVLWDAAAKCWRLVWSRAQTQTTPAGITVAPLNAWPGSAPPFALTQVGLAGCSMAWRLPRSVAGPRPIAEQPASVMALFPTLQEPLRGTASDTIPTWAEVWTPGVPLPESLPGRISRHPRLTLSPVYPLMHGGYALLAIPVRLPGDPLPPGPAAPRHLAVVTLKLVRRVEAERRPFTLFVPVQSRPPASKKAP